MRSQSVWKLCFYNQFETMLLYQFIDLKDKEHSILEAYLWNL